MENKKNGQSLSAPSVSSSILQPPNSLPSPITISSAAIIAFQQPVTRPQIDSIRGVNSDSMMKSLLRKNLILESGRADGPGRPILYSTTPEFLQHFGLNSILEMLPLAKPEEEESKQDELLKG